MPLREQIDADIFGVFLNTEDFGEIHTINGSQVLCIIDKNNIHMRASMGRRTEGVREDSLFLYIKTSEFSSPPKPFSPIEVDGKEYVIRSVSEEMGVLVIEYGGVTSGRREFGNRPRPF
jgi:hypothetical protein